ncbi:MAG TPA: glycosyltransferase family 4 protein [Chloroflexota bacterium]|nr:glycosyltransferase family 4 protein [Chloroflexota bacterium]
MSRLLLLLPGDPKALDAGAKIRNAGLLRLLASDHEVDTLVFGSPPRRSTVRRAADILRSPWPDMAWRLWSPAFAARVRQQGYSAVQAEGIEMARYLSVVPREKRIYDAHNAEFLLQRRVSLTAASLAGAAYSRIQWRRLERFERTIVRNSRLSLAVSQHDANQLLALGGPGVDVRVIPNGIDAAAYPFISASQKAPGFELLFLAKMDFRPNAEALRWFLDHVFPSLPAVRLFAVGSRPPRWLVAAGQHNDRIAVTGYVDDERRYLARTHVLVLPLQTGGGSRLKALVAMASGLPIVSTRLGMEGLDVEPGVHFLPADTAAEWVASLRRLMAEPALRVGLATAGRQLIEQRYDWSALRQAVRAAYDWLP